MSCPCSLQAHWSTESYTTWDRQQYSNNWDSWGSLILRQNLVKHWPSCGINLSLEGHGISKTTNCRGNNTYAGTTYGGCEGFDGIYPHENGLCPRVFFCDFSGFHGAKTEAATSRAIKRHLVASFFCVLFFPLQARFETSQTNR